MNFRRKPLLVRQSLTHGNRKQRHKPSRARYWLEALEDRLAPAVVPLTVTVTGVGDLNDQGRNFYAAITINGVTQDTPTEYGSSFFVDWPIVQNVENTAGPVKVSMALFDGGSQMDVNPQPGNADINLSVDPLTADFSGDVQYPGNILQGDGSDGPACNLAFTISVPGNTSSSGDGIPDSWKTSGIPVGPGLANYQLPGGRRGAP